MRILHVTDCFLPIMGGIETQVSHLALHQAARGDEVAVFTTTLPASGRAGRSRERLPVPPPTAASGTTVVPTPPAATGEPAVPAGRSLAVDVYRLARPMPGGAPIHPLSPREAPALAARLTPDVIHVHMGGTAPSAQLALRGLARHAPTVLQVHSVWTPPVTAAYRVLSAASRFASWGVTLAAVSELAARPLRSATALPVHVVGNGVDLAPWRGEPVPHDGVHVVCATRFAARKRVLPLLRVLKEAAGAVGPAHPLTATIAGEGPDLQAARAFVAEHGMGGWVSLPGRLSPTGLQELYRRADVYLAPVVLEAFSIAILEAQAAGLAVVCRSQSGAAERIVNGTHGITAPDDEGLAHAVARLAREPELLGAIRRHNAANPPPYGWEDVLERTDEVYRAAAAPPPTQAVADKRRNKGGNGPK